MNATSCPPQDIFVMQPGRVLVVAVVMVVIADQVDRFKGLTRVLGVIR
jgi:hypothetical protein